MTNVFDFAVIGAGVFGSWTTHHLRRHGTVVLIDAYGPAHNRASSGGESRIIRMGYGPDDLYTRWSARALTQWQALFERTGRPLFRRTGVLWLVKEGDAYTPQSLNAMQRAGIPVEQFSRADLKRNFPQFACDDISWALLETDSGVLMARQAVQALVADLIHSGVEYVSDAVTPPADSGRLERVVTTNGAQIRAKNFVFACGPWLPKLFPALLSERLFITRQEVFFFGTPAGTKDFRSDAMPTWLCIADQAYGMPDIESRGVKFAFDSHGSAFDPDEGSRIVAIETLQAARQYIGRRFPTLAAAPVVETRVCQYENTSNGDFLIDRHPEFENAWLVGGGSGHGFKHGPMVGEYVAGLIMATAAAEPRFSLASKATIQKRGVF
jgi:monomeric sarcosine oxidase